MKTLHTIHLPHFPYASMRHAVSSALDKLSDNSLAITLAFTIVFGALMILTFWAVVAR